MEKKNLCLVNNNPKAFIDNKYEFYFNHDIQNSFEEEYDEIHQKYLRRVNAFRKMVKSPTVFFRTVRGNQEITYINNNWEYANELVKRYNSNNCIIYVVAAGMNPLTNNVESYELMDSGYKKNTYDMLHLYNQNQELMSVCSKLIEPSVVKTNLQYDIKANVQKDIASYISKCVPEDKPGIDDAITDALGIEKTQGLYLWGQGRWEYPLHTI